jgi:PST family polysaccharide transporter
LQKRSLKIALVVAPLSITSYVIGLPFGPEGVAFAYSTVMLLWLVPHILWCLHGTTISPGDMLVATSKPFFSAILATVVTLGAGFYIVQMHSPLLRLAVEGGIMAFVYYGTLLFVMGEKTLYVDLFRGLRGPVPE